MITKIIVDSIQSPTFDGVSFGEVGRYEKVMGRAFGELDPESPLNAVITDVALAPRNARGKVEYTTDFYILKPIDATRGNKVLLCDVTNRGNKNKVGWVMTHPTVAGAPCVQDDPVEACTGRRSRSSAHS